MSTFALPVPSWRLGSQPRKRKRVTGIRTEASPSPDPEIPSSSSHLPSDSINPRSHSPSTLRQFAAAGLSPEEEIPSKDFPSFPHRSLPRHWQNGVMQSSRSKSRMASATSGSEGDVDTDAESQKYRDEDVLTNASDRIKHMSFMMAILHRCLQEGDIIRAKRAFSLLIRTKDVDIRLNEMWSLGTEILMRHGSTIDLQSPEGVDDTGSGGTSHSNAAASRPYPRWGSARNIHKVRDYLETLSQHYPYDSNYPRSTSAIDFWPALYSIEIYNVDIECKRTLHRLEESSAMNEDDSMIDPPELYTETEDYDTAMQRREDDRVSKRWAAKDEIRHTAQEAAQAIAERLDNLMQTNPFTTHIELLRLRGMLALYIGDLNLPSRLLDRGGAEDNNIGSRLQSLSLNDHVRKSAQNQEERDAVRRREAEIERARGFFGRIIERGGELPAWLLKFLDPDEDEASILS